MDINQLRDLLRSGEVVKPSKAIWDKIPEAEKTEARAEVIAEAMAEAKAEAPTLAAPKVLEAKRLAYRDDKSDKVYIARLLTGTDGATRETFYMLEAEWGRRGKTMQCQKKGAWKSRSQAYTAYVDLVSSKVRKGYREEAL